MIGHVRTRRELAINIPFRALE